MQDSTQVEALRRWREALRIPVKWPHVDYCQCADCRKARGLEPIDIEEQVELAERMVELMIGPPSQRSVSFRQEVLAEAARLEAYGPCEHPSVRVARQENDPVTGMNVLVCNLCEHRWEDYPQVWNAEERS